MLQIEIENKEYEILVDGFIVDRATTSVEYAEDYMNNYIERSKTHMSKQLTALRKAYAEAFAGPDDKIIDVGCAVGLIIQSDSSNRWKGTDINPLAEQFIGDRYVPHPADLSEYAVITFQDCFEHLNRPEDILSQIKPGTRVVMTIPVWPNKLSFEGLTEWLHYKPNEHYIYCTRDGLLEFMCSQGFDLLDEHRIETSMGRLDSGTFCFIAENTGNR